MPLLPLTTGNSSQGHTNERPTLPPIRDLFRDELQRRPVTPQFSPSTSLARLNVNDDDYPEPAGRYYHSSSSSYGKVLPPGCTCPDRFCPTHSASSSRSTASSHLGMRDTHPYNSQRNYSGSRTKAHYSDDPHRRMNPQYSPEVPPSTNNRFLNEHRSQSMLSGSPPSLSITTFPRTRSMTQDDERTPIPIDRFSPSKGPPTSTLISINRYPPDDQITGAGKYECEYCGKGFNRPSSLKIHLNSHTGEKPFTCPVEGCGRSFSVLSNMRRHTRVHATTAGDAGHDEAQTYPISLSYTQKWEQRRDSSASISSDNSRSSHSLSSDGDD